MFSRLNDNYWLGRICNYNCDRTFCCYSGHVRPIYLHLNPFNVAAMAAVASRQVLDDSACHTVWQNDVTPSTVCLLGKRNVETHCFWILIFFFSSHTIFSGLLSYAKLLWPPWSSVISPTGAFPKQQLQPNTPPTTTSTHTYFCLLSGRFFFLLAFSLCSLNTT